MICEHTSAVATDIVMLPHELVEITGKTRAKEQLEVLHARGFVRAWIGRHKQVVLARAHYESVKDGTYGKSRQQIEDERNAALFKQRHAEALEFLARAERERQEQKAAERAQRAEAVRRYREETAPARALAHAAVVRHHAGKRRAARIQRTPPWADMDAIRRVYEEAARLTAETGIPHHVDHEIPLQGKLVSGLHVHTNLQILTGTENSRKKNRFEIEP